jgi:cytochrome P450
MEARLQRSVVPPPAWFATRSEKELRDPLKLALALQADFGDAVCVREQPTQSWLFFHPDAAKSVFVDHPDRYAKGTTADGLRALLGRGLLTAEGKFWRTQRRLMQPAFHRDQIERMSATMVAVAHETLQALQSPGPAQTRINVGDLFANLTFAVVTRCLFGVNMQDEAERMRHTLNTGMRAIEQGPSSPDLGPIVVSLREIVNGILDRAEASPDTASAGVLLDLLRKARDSETGRAMTERQLRDEVLTLVLAGHETTGALLSMAVFCLAKHPDIQDRLAAEVRAVLGGRAPTPTDLPALRSCTEVLEESMRVFPPIWLIGRTAIADDVVLGHEIPKGSDIAIVPWVIHRHAEFWEQPERFDPSRFAPDRISSRPKYSYLPFGAGQRTCIGESFAMTEATLVLALFVERFAFRLAPGFVLELEPLVTLRPKNGIDLLLTPRP